MIIYCYEPLKVFFIHAMRTYRGSISLSPLILNLGIIWRQVINITPSPSTSWTEAWKLLNRRLGGSRAGLDILVKRKSVAPTRIHSACSLVYMLTALSWLSVHHWKS